MAEKKAWDMIGWESQYGSFQIKGGRAKYDTIIYNDDKTRTGLVRLCRLEMNPGWHEVSRYVEPDTLLIMPEEGLGRFLYETSGH